MHGPDDNTTIDRAAALARDLYWQDRFAEAEPLFAVAHASARFRRAVASTQPSAPAAETRWAARVAAGYGMCLARNAKVEQAKPILLKAVDLLQSSAPGDPDLGRVARALETTSPGAASVPRPATTPSR
jgi:hypothetical protein